MTKYDLGRPAERFIAAALALTTDDWTEIVTRGRETGAAKREIVTEVQSSLSAAERSAFEKRVAQHIGNRLDDVFEELPLRVGAKAQIAFDTAVFALQKRDVLPEEVLRTWFGPFESVGIHLETLLEDDE